MKLYKFIVLFLVLTFFVVSLNNVYADAKPSLQGYSVETITVEFRKLDSFVSYRENRQVLDFAGARAAGTPESIIALAQQVIEYQNRMRTKAEEQSIESVADMNIPLTYLPLLIEFKGMLQNYIPSTEIVPSAPDTHPCGTYSHPVPNYTPARQYLGWYNDAHNTLLSWGFHQTAGYACGQDPFIPCDRDYTRGRGYSGPYGYCESPRFRDQGTRDTGNHEIWIQYGEPNPEIFSYVWPYWDWGWYVEWWHDTY